jgi:hypothetical protein
MSAISFFPFRLNRIDSGLTRVSLTIKDVLERFFRRNNNEGSHRWMQAIWILPLYLVGIYAWGVFFNWGSFSLEFHDWYEISGPRIAFLKDAVTTGQLPLHISDVMALGNFTDRYLAIPDAFLSPQVFLLKYLSVGQFVLTDVWLMYTIGFAGLIFLQRRFKLSGAAFAMLFMLFNLNGHILAHYTVGHASWGGYFLFPWFAILVFQLLDGRRSWVWVAEMAGLLLAMVLQGSFHQYVWCLLFLGFLALTERRTFFPALTGAGFSIGISLFRIYPARLILSHFANDYIGGYPSLSSIWDALVNIQTPDMSIPYTNSFLGAWESTLYVGLIGALFIAYFGIYRWLNPRLHRTGYQQMFVPVIALTIFSLGIAYGTLRDVFSPVLNSERAVSRIISLPLSFISVFAAAEFQNWIDGLRSRTGLTFIGLLAALLIEAFDLAKNFTVWEIKNAVSAFETNSFQLSRWTVTNHADPAYTHCLVLGLIGTAFFLAILAALMMWEYWRNKARRHGHASKQGHALLSKKL